VTYTGTYDGMRQVSESGFQMPWPDTAVAGKGLPQAGPGSGWRVPLPRAPAPRARAAYAALSLSRSSSRARARASLRCQSLCFKLHGPGPDHDGMAAMLGHGCDSPAEGVGRSRAGGSAGLSESIIGRRPSRSADSDIWNPQIIFSKFLVLVY
jgi:hypothetical protein